ncbi:hypothetical protein F4778DRAFT_517129 [Xylariomycetidae sp. FL2044]|nr:hypothetical protein F4778DRAFT_517129 [Xylariomycetidae sp. FL2044]
MDVPGTRVPSVVTKPLLAVSVVFPVLSAGSVYLRMRARNGAPQSVRSDDVWLFISWISTFSLSILVWIYGAKAGVDFYKVDAVQGTQDSLAMVFLSACIIALPLSSVKIAILLFYKRVFPLRVFNICVWVAIGVVSAWGLIFFFLVLTQVDPISASWKGGRLRYNSTALGVSQVATSIALDLVVLCFPLPVISRLNMNKSRKIAVSLIFWLGGFCCVAAIVRLVLLNQSIRDIIHAQSHIYLQDQIYIFKIIEPNCSIIAACLPCYGPLFKGGRAAESLIRSVRSIVSLASGRSHGSSRSSRLRRQQGRAAAESEIELRNLGYPGNVQQDAHCIAGKDSQDVEGRSLEPEDRIRVTRGVSVEEG